MSEKIENNILDNSENFFKENIPHLPHFDMFPYACYIDDKTIITQNGELLQTIKIPSFVETKDNVNSFSLRTNLNKSFITHTKNNKNLNFWFQVVRKKVNLKPKNQQHTNYITKKIIEKWDKYYDWENQYANEIYVTIVITPEDNSVNKGLDFLKAVSFSMLKNSKLKELRKMQAELDTCVNGFLKDLKEYETKLLTIIKINNVYYSEHLSFFNNLLNNEQKNIVLPINNLSESLITRKFLYETNSVKGFNNQNEYFLSIISVKYVNFLLLSQLDKIIQLNQELVISQIVSYTESKNLNDLAYEKIDKLSVNEDDYVLRLTDWRELLNDDKHNPTDSCINQLLIIVKGKTKDELEINVKNLLKVTKTIGIVVVREEMFMPTLFWSILPANFNFIKRIHYLPKSTVAGYSSLYNFPIGKMNNNHWGDCLLIFKSALETPYFFPLHVEKNGNLILVGPKNLKKTKYLNFLILAALKQCEKIYYLDNTNRSNVFINSIGGESYFITKRDAKNRLIFNPFSMDKTPENLKFILKWTEFIVFQEEDGLIKLEENSTAMQQEWNKLSELIKTNISTITSILSVYELAKSNNCNNVANSLKKWVDPEKYGMIFIGENDVFKINANKILGLNLSSIINNEILKISIMDYILYRILSLAKEERTILAIDESWLLFDNKIIGPKFVEIFQQLYNKNIVIMTTSSGSDSYEHSNLKNSIKNLFSSVFLFPNIKTTVYQKKIFTISEEESKIISIMSEEKNNFLLKNGKNVIISSFDFSFLNSEEEVILQSNSININIMKKAKELINSEKPEDWLPVFFELSKEYNKQKLDIKQKEREKRQIQWEEAKQDANNNNKILNAE